MAVHNAHIPVVILSGGRGIYIDDSGKRISKSNVFVQGAPLISYVILSYLTHGFRNFIISGSYQLEETKKHLQKTFTEGFFFKNKKFSIEFVDSGYEAKTGDRILAVTEHLKGSTTFAVTYSDSVSLHNIAEELEDHLKSGMLCTLLGVRLPTRFRILGVRPGEKQIRGFSEKPFFRGDYINGGFYFFQSSFLQDPVWQSRSSLLLEEEILDSLVARESIQNHFHEGEWHYLDCERDLAKLNAYCEMIKANVDKA